MHRAAINNTTYGGGPCGRSVNDQDSAGQRRAGRANTTQHLFYLSSQHAPNFPGSGLRSLTVLSSNGCYHWGVSQISRGDRLEDKRKDHAVKRISELAFIE
jgi:hypothetical protein